jgi:hypothetical protein
MGTWCSWLSRSLSILSRRFARGVGFNSQCVHIFFTLVGHLYDGDAFRFFPTHTVMAKIQMPHSPISDCVAILKSTAVAKANIYTALQKHKIRYITMDIQLKWSSSSNSPLGYDISYPPSYLYKYF